MSDKNSTANPRSNNAMTDLAKRVRANQKKLASTTPPNGASKVSLNLWPRRLRRSALTS
jgi:hypothetical protein